VRVVVAPDKFKGCLTAAEVADALAEGLRSASAGVTVTAVPVADGGDGTVAAALSAGYDAVLVEVEGPTGEPGDVPYALRGGTAVVELAAACGLERLPDGKLQALRASTFGLGQVIADAIDRGATEVIVGLGGSASTDGGAGALQALGGRLLDASGGEIGRGGAALRDVARFDVTELRSRTAGIRVLVAVDVDNPLLGPRGAATVFGPQKGAGPEDVEILESGLTRWAQVVAESLDVDRSDDAGAGAAGGTAFGLLALLGAELRPGIELVLDLVSFDAAVAGADLVITGEGSLDEQSMAGKTPVGVAAAAARAGVPTVAVAGRNLLSEQRARTAGISAVYPLSDLEPDPARSMTNARDLLRSIGARIAAERSGQLS
jgi:glycerate kinase